MSSAQSVTLNIGYICFICHGFKVDQINYVEITFQYGNLFIYIKKKITNHIPD